MKQVLRHWPATHAGFEFGTRHDLKQVPQFEMSVCRSGALLSHSVLLPPLPPAPAGAAAAAAPATAPPLPPVPPLPPRPARPILAAAAAAGVGTPGVDEATVRRDQLDAEIPDAVVASRNADDRQPH